MFLIIIHCEKQLINKLCNFDFTIPNPVKVFRPPSKPLSCVRQCNSRYHSAMEHGSFLAVFPAPLTRPALPSQSFRHRRRSPHRVCPASRTRPTAAIRRYGRSRALPTLTNSLNFYYGPRPDNSLFAPSGRRRFRTSSVVCSLRFQSVVRSLATSPP